MDEPTAPKCTVCYHDAAHECEDFDSDTCPACMDAGRHAARAVARTAWRQHVHQHAKNVRLSRQNARKHLV